jgi:hypothetical protein
MTRTDLEKLARDYATVKGIPVPDRLLYVAFLAGFQAGRDAAAGVADDKDSQFIDYESWTNGYITGRRDAAKEIRQLGEND